MLKLMKYEFRKTMGIKLIFLAITAILEIVFLAGLTMAKDELLAFSIAFLTLAAIFGPMLIGLYSILTLHHDMNTRQSYMLFMTPHSSFAILGAKVLENGLSILLVGLAYFAIGSADVTMLFAKRGELNQLMNYLRQFNIDINIDPQLIMSGMFSLLAAWFSVVTAAYLADVLASALLNGKKFAGLLGFVFFIVLNIFTSWIEGSVWNSVSTVTSPMSIPLTLSIVSVLLSAVMYGCAAVIMERKLSV